MPAPPRIPGIPAGRRPVPRPAQKPVPPVRPAPRQERAAGRTYWARLLPLLAVLAALTRLPSFLRPIWNPDEGFLATEARLLAHGGVLYQTVVDRKPPLLPWLYEGALALFGYSSLWPLRTLAVLAHLATAGLLAGIARRRWGDRAGVLAAVGYLLVSAGLAPQDAQAAGFEVFMLPWTAAAFWCADRRRWTAAGLAVAGAALTKQTGAAVLLPVLWMLWRGAVAGDAGQVAGQVAGRGSGAVGRRVRAAAALAAGLLVPLVVAALALGGRRFLFWTVTGSAAYASPSGAWAVAAERGFGNAGIVLAACAGFVLPMAGLAARRRRAVRRLVEADVWLWLAASGLAVVAGFQFFGHYYLQLLPPLVLAGAGVLRALPRWRRPALAWTALAACGFLGWALAAPRTDLDHADAVAAAVARHTAPDQRVLVWGMHPEDYWLARRLPASRFLTAGFLTNFSGGRDGVRVGERYAVPGAWRTFRDEMRRHPPALVVDDSRGQPYGPSRIPALRELLRAHYRPIGVCDGAVLYARR